MDRSTIIGLLIAAAAVIGGHWLQGGSPGSIFQPTAALIVLGGTMGAVALQFPAGVLRRALAEARRVFRHPPEGTDDRVATLIALARRARREGLIALDRETEALEDPFLRRAMELAVDGVPPQTVRTLLEMQLAQEEERGDESIRVFEAAGGYAPTVGILGAVLGLIHVMQNLSDATKLGTGIAVAFVATVYGVAAANLLFLPMAGKLRHRHRERTLRMEITIEGVGAIVEGGGPRDLERRLAAFVDERRAASEAPGEQARA